MSELITIRFYEELNDFLPIAKRKVSFELHFVQAGNIKDSLGSQIINNEYNLHEMV